MSTNPRPSKLWRMRLELATVFMKSRHIYAKPWLKISSKERKCPSKAEEDIYLMCCSIHNSHMSTLWLNQNLCIFSKNTFYLKFKLSALVGTPCIIIYHDFFPPSRRGSHVKSDFAHTIIKHSPLSKYTRHLAPWFSVVATLLQFTPTASCTGIPPLSR